MGLDEITQGEGDKEMGRRLTPQCGREIRETSKGGMATPAGRRNTRSGVTEAKRRERVAF